MHLSAVHNYFMLHLEIGDLVYISLAGFCSFVYLEDFTLSRVYIFQNDN